MERSRPAVFTVPAQRAFADALAAGLIARAKGDRLALAAGIVLLPNNRAVRAVTDAFVRRADGGLLLPRLVAIGDADLDERLGPALDRIGEEAPVPRAIEPLARRMLLARLIEEERAGIGDPVDAAEAVRLAADLARTIDQLVVERKRIEQLVDPALAAPLAEHWQRAFRTFAAVLARWPAALAARGEIDLSERRERLLAQAERRWRDDPPPGFVAAAGIVTPAPAVAALLRRVARMERGLVLLPGLDLAMPEDEWRSLGPHAPDPDTGLVRRATETHPQFAPKLLLDRMDVARGEVRRWRYGTSGAPPARARAVANALAPADFSEKWQTLTLAERRLSGIRALALATPADEAQAIAVAIREAIETPGRTVALVTPDRALARRVSAHLKRWRIDADDSAGRPLSATPPGTLLLALARAAAERFAPVALLALLKHPLVRSGEARARWLAGARRLDRALRGPRPPAGLGAIGRWLAAGDAREARVRGAARAWWREASGLLAPLEAAFLGEAAPALLFAALREAAGRLAGDAAWAGPAGRAAAELFESLEESIGAGPRGFTAEAMPRLLGGLMDEVAVRPPQGGHPRVSVWGLIEARLQHADLVILGGLNEGVWPAPPAPDPWLGPGLRAALALPGLERRIGLAAHDFASLLCARQVLVTRARRDARSPAIASRFWLRLEAMTGGVTREPVVGRLARALDRPARFAPATQPAPRPPRAARPTSIAVTALDRLKADPFAFYAGAILKLSAWDAVDAEPSAAWRGSAVHAVLEEWAARDDYDPARLRARAEALLRSAGTHPVTRALWTPRLLEAIDWIAAELTGNLAAGRRPIASEVAGGIDIAGVRLHGRVDRIDRRGDGGLAIIDYKTGKPPSPKAVAEGYAMQLGLLGLIAERGAFDGVDGVPIDFEYWSLSSKGGKLGHVASPVQGRAALIAPEDFTTRAAASFVDAAAKWLTGDASFTAKLSPEHAPYADYDQLMRLAEWYGRQPGPVV